MATLSPLRYPGGKDKTYKYVKHLVEENNIQTYVEPFAGGAAVALRLLFNGDVKRVIINDIDRGIYAIWNAIIKYPDKLIQLIVDTPITTSEWHKQKDIQKQKDTIDELSLAFSTLFLNRTNFSGIIKAGMLGGKSQTKNKIDCRFNKGDIIKRIKKIHSYKSQIKIYNMDAKDFIVKVIKKTRKSLTFFDPPYYDKGPDLYTNFYKHSDHVELARVIKTQMRNRYWILTYDIAIEIEKLYKNHDFKKYYLNYSVAKPTEGQEFLFYSKKINRGLVEQYLKLFNPASI